MVEKNVNISCVISIDVDEHHSFVEALNGEDSQYWKKNMEYEFQSLQNNKIWILTPLPLGHNLMNCKWIFKIKYNADGFMARHKVHLVAMGFTQIEGIDYNETFFPIAQMELIQVKLVVATIEDLEMHQMDVKTTFLNGDLS
jgi:hypothetical protein